MEEQVGFVESLVFLLWADPMPEIRQEDELSILSGDRDFLPVGNEWKGQIPEGVKLVVRDNMPARLVYKIWAGNTSHLAKASFGQRRGYQWAWQSDEDPYVRKCAAFCAREARFGVAAEFGMQESELRDHPEERFDPASINKDVEDPLTRIAQDPKRKLARNDRLVGPALLCLKPGRLPYYLCLLYPSMSRRSRNPLLQSRAALAAAPGRAAEKSAMGRRTIRATELRCRRWMKFIRATSVSYTHLDGGGDRVRLCSGGF